MREEVLLMPTKKLYKSTVGKKVDGVCTGLSIYFGIDVALIRLIFVILTFMGGPGIIAYIVCAVIMPNEPEDIDYTYYKNDNENHN
jgi:phage shock protein C